MSPLEFSSPCQNNLDFLGESVKKLYKRIIAEILQAKEQCQYYFNWPISTEYLADLLEACELAPGRIVEVRIYHRDRRKPPAIILISSETVYHEPPDFRSLCPLLPPAKYLNNDKELNFRNTGDYYLSDPRQNDPDPVIYR